MKKANWGRRSLAIAVTILGGIVLTACSSSGVGTEKLAKNGLPEAMATTYVTQKPVFSEPFGGDNISTFTFIHSKSVIQSDGNSGFDYDFTVVKKSQIEKYCRDRMALYKKEADAKGSVSYLITDMSKSEFHKVSKETRFKGARAYEIILSDKNSKGIYQKLHFISLFNPDYDPCDFNGTVSKE